MGGKALKNTTTRRYDAQEYHELVPEVEARLRAILPGHRVRAIPAYRTKESFGDMDVLVEGPLPSDIKEQLLAAFSPNETVYSGPVISFDYKELQIDLIKASTEEYDFSMHYYGYNDLGNLLGKIAHKFGVKYGHDGMFYIHRDGDHIFNEIVLTRDPKTALSFLQLSAERHAEGFDTLQSMFEYVATSPYFSPAYYLLSEEQKNATDRVRANKRKSYQAFLDWAEANRAQLPAYVPNKDKASYLPMIQAHFSHFEQELQASNDRVKQKHAEDEIIQAKFNVQIVRELVDSDKALNKVMTQFNQGFTDKAQRRTWLLQATSEEVLSHLKSLPFFQETNHGR